MEKQILRQNYSSKRKKNVSPLQKKNEEIHCSNRRWTDQFRPLTEERGGIKKRNKRVIIWEHREMSPKKGHRHTHRAKETEIMSWHLKYIPTTVVMLEPIGNRTDYLSYLYIWINYNIEYNRGMLVSPSLVIIEYLVDKGATSSSKIRTVSLKE